MSRYNSLVSNAHNHIKLILVWVQNECTQRHEPKSRQKPQQQPRATPLRDLSSFFSLFGMKDLRWGLVVIMLLTIISMFSLSVHDRRVDLLSRYLVSPAHVLCDAE